MLRPPEVFNCLADLSFVRSVKTAGMQSSLPLSAREKSLENAKEYFPVCRTRCVRAGGLVLQRTDSTYALARRIGPGGELPRTESSGAADLGGV